jgi:hypothetical protein
MSSLSTPKPVPKSVTPEIQVGPIISWPFFGSNRGELSHPNEIDRGPWRTTYDYLLSCAEREIAGVIRENEGKSAPHRLHLDPAEIMSSRHHHLNALPGDKSDDSEEWDLEESEEEWEGPGDVMYRDYRRMQRSTFLVAHMATREQSVRKEMQRWMRLAERLGVRRESTHTEEFGLDCHDLSLENVFVDEHDNAKIVSSPRFWMFGFLSLTILLIDLHHRLGIHHYAAPLGMCPPSGISPIKRFYGRPVPKGRAEASDRPPLTCAAPCVEWETTH